MKLFSTFGLNNLGWLIIGGVIFSPLIVTITMKGLGFPFMIPEIFLFPLLFIYKRYVRKFFNFINSLIPLLFLFFLLAISLLVQEFDLSAVFSTFRGYLYMVLAFSCFYNRKISNLDWLIYLSIGTILGWIVVSVHNFFLLSENFSSARTAITGNMITLIFALSIPFIWSKYKFLLVVLILISILSVFSGIRRLIILTLITICLLLFFNFWNKNKNLKLFIIIFSFAISLLLIYPTINSFLYEHSPDLYRRLIFKSEMLVNNDISETDLFRYDMIINIEDHIQWNIFPKGFVTKRSIDNNIYIDFPIYELFYMIGMPLCFIIFLVFAYRIIYHLKNFIFNKVRESEFCIVLSILLIILLFTEGTFLNYPFTTPFTGYALARIFSNNNLIS